MKYLPKFLLPIIIPVCILTHKKVQKVSKDDGQYFYYRYGLGQPGSVATLLQQQ